MVVDDLVEADHSEVPFRSMTTAWSSAADLLAHGAVSRGTARWSSSFAPWFFFRFIGKPLGVYPQRVAAIDNFITICLDKDEVL